MKRRRPLWLLLAVVAWAVAVGPVAVAQEYRANLFVEVDANGEPLGGATVTLLGQDFERTMTTDAEGRARFMKLEPGMFTLTVMAPGHNTMVMEGVQLNTLANVTMPVTMVKSELEERVVVTAETPLLDQRKTGTSTVLTQTELSQVPTSRDPWAVLSTVPGITTDRVNVAGNEAGQQSNFLGKGDDGANTTWVMDGVEFTDLGAIGSSPTYFDFNVFEEIGFVTGGADVDQTNGGTRLNFTTKQGSNETSANIRLFYTDSGLQDDIDDLHQPANVDVRPPFTNGPGDVGNNLLPNNQIEQVFEKNFNIGGPIWKDHIWYWFGFGHNQIDNLLASGTQSNEALIETPDKTELKNITGKVHGQVAYKFNWKLFYSEGDKIKDGRGAAVTRPLETTWDQKGPTPLYTVYGSYTFSPNFELSAQYGHVDGKFSLTPKGGMDRQVIQDTDLIWHNTYLFYDTVRPQDQAVVRGINFFDTGDWEHEVKYGYRYKDSEVESVSKWTNNDFFVYYGAYVYLYRERNLKVTLEHHNAWVGDTITKDNWAFNVGVNWSLQSGNNEPTSVNAVAACPTCLPGVVYGGSDKVFEWDDISPRLGATYTFDTKKRLLLRANYAQYVDQLSAGDVVYDNPTGAYVYVTQYWAASPYHPVTDPPTPPAPGEDFVVDPGEFSTACGDALNASGDPCNILDFRDKIDPNFEAPRTDEIIVGAEYELLRDFTVAANLTWRQRERERWFEGNLDGRPVALNGPLYDVPHYNATGELRAIPSTGYDCVPTVVGTFPDGTPFTETICNLNAFGESLTDDGRPTFVTNRPGYEQEYAGIELTATKRLSNKWMLRSYLAINDWTQHFNGTAGISDPTNTQGGTTEQNGDIAVPSVGSGTKDGVWLGTSRWQFNLNGLYQLPKDWTVSANLYGREGYGIPYIDRVGTKDIQIGEIGDRRYDDLWTLDLGIGKVIKVGGATLELRGEVFNALNENTVLSVKPRVDQPTNVNAITEHLSPRIVRIGASINF